MLKDAQNRVDEALQVFEKPYWSPLSICARIAEETGELARILNHIYGDKPKKPEEEKQHLGEEIMDVIFACICLANSHNINLDDEFKKTIEKVTVRDKNRFVNKK